MNPRVQNHLASAAVSLTVVALAAVLPLAFYIPKLMLVWQDSNYELALWQVLLARSSSGVTAWGWPLLMMLAVFFLGALTWRVFLFLHSRRLAT